MRAGGDDGCPEEVVSLGDGLAGVYADAHADGFGCVGTLFGGGA